jgi:NAD(P)H dehydrogenase (quinone)
MLLVSGHESGYTVEQHGNAIDAAVRAGVKLIVYTSHCGSDADNTATVCQDHYDTEQKLMRSGVGWTVLRIGMYADTLANALVPLALRTGKWFTCSDGGKVSLVDRDDCIACTAVALTRAGHENRIYNITGADVWSFRDVADLATEITGKRIDVINVCVEDFCDYLGSLGVSRAPTPATKRPFAWGFDDIVSFEKEMRNGKFAIKSADIRLLTGQAPKSFRSFMFEHAQPLRAAAANTDRMKA